MIWLLLALTSTALLCDCRRPGAGILDHDIHIKEGVARFLQRIKSNLYDNVVYYNNPNHNEISGTHMLQDFTQGKQISCWPELRQCFMENIDRSVYPDPGATIRSIGHMWNKGINSMNENQVTKKLYYFIINGTEITDLVFLSSHLRDFISQFGYPLYPIVLLPNDAQFITGNLPPTNRNKRQITNSRTCSDGSLPMPKYGWTQGRCDYLNFCKYIGIVNGHEKFDCGNNHVIGRKAFACFCCPNEHTVSTCTDCKEQGFVNG